MKTLQLQNKLQQPLLIKLLFIMLLLFQFFTSNLYALSSSQWDFSIKNPEHEQHFKVDSGGIYINAVPNKKQYIRYMELYINDHFISRKTQQPYVWRELHTAPRGTYNLKIKAVDTDGDVHEKTKTIYIINQRHTQTPFQILVKTDNFGASDNNQFKIPMVTGNKHSYRIDCDSDGLMEDEEARGSYTCEYSRPGRYLVSVYSDHPRISFFTNSYINDRLKITSIEQWGNGEWRSMKNAFFRCSLMTSNATDTPNLSQVKSMRNMFKESANYNNPTIQYWNVSNVTDMSGMFYKARKFNQILSFWDVSNVTDMRGMFTKAEKFNQAIGNWDVGNVTDMREMFHSAKNFNPNIGNWDISNVSHMNGMFSNVTISSENYSDMLINWAQLNLKPDVLFNSGNSKYSYSAANPRFNIIKNSGWTIKDRGPLGFGNLINPNDVVIIPPSASDEVSEPYRLRTFGTSRGGGTWLGYCNPNKIITGLRYSESNSYVNYINVICSPINDLGNLINNETPGLSLGGSSFINLITSPSKSLKCPSGFALSGVRASSGLYVNRLLAIRCTQYKGTETRVKLSDGSNGRGTPRTENCRGNDLVNRIYMQKGFWLDYFTVSCDAQPN